MSVELHLGDCREVMATMPANSIDSIVCDPPYGLSFMGKGWDHGVPGVPFWAAALRVAKPGSFLLAFGGTRTFHRLTVAIEDAGWEIRDCLMWVYGSGFPKSHDISKAIDKAAYEIPLWDSIREHIRQWRDIRGWNNKQLNEAIGSENNGCGMARHWTSEIGGQHSIPSKEQWRSLKAALAWPDCELDAIYDEVKDGAARPVVGRGTSGKTAIWNEAGKMGDFDITAPATVEAKQWDGWGTALKPAWEPIILAMKPLDGTFANNALTWGVGGLNIDACRVGLTPEDAEYTVARAGYRDGLEHISSAAADENGHVANQVYGKYGARPHSKLGHVAQGRWPANLILDDQAGALLDEMSGTLTSGGGIKSKQGVTDSNNVFGQNTRRKDSMGPQGMGIDTGGASRFFYCAKASKRDRDEGLEGMEERPTKSTGWSGESMPTRNDTRPGRTVQERPEPTGRNHHPTVKPTALMRYLVRLVTPKGGTVLDCFAGSGSTGKAAVLEGFNFVGIELDAEYLTIAEKRIAHATAAQAETHPQLSLLETA